jgi:hypothetical protein
MSLRLGSLRSTRASAHQIGMWLLPCQATHLVRGNPPVEQVATAPLQEGLHMMMHMVTGTRALRYLAIMNVRHWSLRWERLLRMKVSNELESVVTEDCDGGKRKACQKRVMARSLPCYWAQPCRMCRAARSAMETRAAP